MTKAGHKRIHEERAKKLREEAREESRGYGWVRASGRCATGAERDAGKHHHAVRLGPDGVVMKYAMAECGLIPGRTSEGWVMDWSRPLSETKFCLRCEAAVRRQDEKAAKKEAPR